MNINKVHWDKFGGGGGSTSHDKKKINFNSINSIYNANKCIIQDTTLVILVHIYQQKRFFFFFYKFKHAMLAVLA